MAVIAVNGCGQTYTPIATQSPTATLPQSTKTTETENGLFLQLDNNYPVSLLSTKSPALLEDNRIGANAKTENIDSRLWSGGGKWIRLIIDAHGEWQHVDWEREEYKIDSFDEKVVDDILDSGVSILLVLDVWHPEERTVFYKSEEDIAIYTSWVRFMVRHFKGRINYYEILNEPDMDFNSPSGMPVDAYANLVRHIVPIIREEDPDAKIVVGALPDTRFNDVRKWLRNLLDSGVMPLVDGLSWHGMYGAAPSNDPRGNRQPDHPQMKNYWENYPVFVEEIKDAAISNGFEGEFLSEEMIWRTPIYQRHPHEPDDYTDISGAKYTARAIIIHLGLDVAPGLAFIPEDDRPQTYAVIRSLSTIMAGAEPKDIPITIDSEESNIKYYGFTLSNGDQLLAIWVDDAAVDDFPGIPLTLTMNDSSAETVFGLDPLSGIQQKLISENQGEYSLIEGLMVKDYPIIIKFIN